MPCKACTGHSSTCVCGWVLYVRPFRLRPLLCYILLPLTACTGGCGANAQAARTSMALVSDGEQPRSITLCPSSWTSMLSSVYHGSFVITRFSSPKARDRKVSSGDIMARDFEFYYFILLILHCLCALQAAINQGVTIQQALGAGRRQM